MNFDILSMKQRAKALKAEQGSTSIAVSVLWAILTVAAFVISYYMLDADYVFSGMFVLVFLLIFISVCSKWYSLKVTREETTSVSDVVAALKEKQLKAIILILIKIVLYFISLALLFVGFCIPFYCLRMSEYVIKDENINVFKAMGKSFSLLKGHFGELIKLDISNLGWLALNVFTLGLGGIYTKAYLGILYAEFYDYLKAQAEL